MPSLQSVVASALVAHALTSAGALMAQTSLTIYNDGRVLARRTLPLTLPKGSSTQRLELGRIEPGTLVPLDPDVQLLRSEYDGDASAASALRRLVGRTVSVERGRPGGGFETITVTVLGADPLRFRMPDGTVAFDNPGGSIRFPADAVGEPGVNATLQSASARKELRVGYFTSGAAWASFDELRKGTLERDMLADIVIFSADLFSLPPDRQLEAEVVMTIMDGKVVFRRDAPDATDQ